MSEGIIPSGSASSASGDMYVTVDEMRDGTERYPNILITESISDADLTDMITDASSLLDRATGDHFLPTSTTIVVDGPPTDGFGRTRGLLPLPRRVRAVTAVSTIAADGTTLEAYAGDSYRVHSSLIDATTADTPIFLGGKGMDAIQFLYGPAEDSITLPSSAWIPFGGRYPAYPRAVAVAGEFDWATTPEPVKRATAILVWSWANTMTAAPQAKSYTSGGATFQLSEDGYTGITEVDRIIRQYRRPSLVLAAI